MRAETLDILRCPFCGGRLAVMERLYHERAADDLVHAVLACQCCAYPVVDGIVAMHVHPNATAARAHLERGQPIRARQVLLGYSHEETCRRFDAAAERASTYAQLVDALGPSYEGRYFLYRFSDPSFVVVDALIRGVGGAVLGGTRRAIDVCGGSGHLSRVLQDVTTAAPVIADLHFDKLWLARRFVSPGCEAVCCDGDGPLPFARGAFSFTLCADSFMFIWSKRALVAEMLRLVDSEGAPGAVAITHAHNQLVWSPSHGQPLTPGGYRALFDTVPARVFSEARLLREVVGGGPLNLATGDASAVLDADAALALVASTDPSVFRSYEVAPPAWPARGVYRVNPLYAVAEEGSRLVLRLTFPNAAYEEEFGACRAYLPETYTLDREALDRLLAGGPPDELREELRRRVLVDLPRDYV